MAAAFALTLSLLASLAELPAPSLGSALAAPASADDPGYAAAIAAVEDANLAVNSDPEAHLGELADAIIELAEYGPALASDPAGREALDLSRLNLARALLLSKDEDGAAAVMDQVLRDAGNRELAIDRFGPTLVRFHDRRRAALDAAGTAAIQVHCELDCRIVIDARPTTGDSGPLYLGEHRVWVLAADGSQPAAEHRVTLDEAGVTTVLRYPEAAPESAPEPAPAPPPGPDPGPRRLIPHWAEISVTAIGLGAVVAGGVMLGLDGRCPGGLDPVADAQRCPELYEGTAGGLVAIGVGSVLTVAGAVTLAVDEVRVANQRGRQATLTWRVQF